MGTVIFSKYSNERSRCFDVRTDIVKEGEGRLVRKTPLYEEGRTHVANLCRWYEVLDREYKKAGLSCNKCEAEGSGVRLEYLEGDTLEERLDGLLEKGEPDKAAGRLMDYLKKVQGICAGEPFRMTEEFVHVFGNVELTGDFQCAPVTNIDMVCSNVVLTEPPCVLDYEWTFAFPIPREFVLYRVIHYYLETHTVRNVLLEMDFYGKMGITPQMRTAFAKMEKGFQSYITGKHVPMREMFEAMTPGVVSMQEAGTGMLQVFFSCGEGFTEKCSKRFVIEEGRADIRVELPDGCTHVRVDPGDHPGALRLKGLDFDGREVSLLESMAGNGCILDDWIYFTEEDPRLEPIPVPKGARTLGFHGEVYPSSPAVLKALTEKHRENARLREKTERQARLIKDMKNTKVWKLYQSYRNKVERKK